MKIFDTTMPNEFKQKNYNEVIPNGFQAVKRKKKPHSKSEKKAKLEPENEPFLKISTKVKKNGGIKDNSVLKWEQEAQKSKLVKKKKKKNLVVVKNDKVKGKKSKAALKLSSTDVGLQVFKWMISPQDDGEFFKNIWEKKPMYISRKGINHYGSLCSVDDLMNTLKNQEVFFSKNIDVTYYTDGIRTTENPSGRARPNIVSSFLQNGRSIRLLNPQTFIPKIATLLASLQEYFRCFVGANMYLTPANSQGFAPHYDDIEAFVLQLEGEKLWKVYQPLTPAEKLPRFSSPNFSQDEIGKPILELTLRPGDLLYFPRGYIHQAWCVPGKHSLHLTVSCYQRNSWADLMEKMVPIALQSAIEEDPTFREGLPINYLNHLGVTNEDTETPEREAMLIKVKALFSKLADYCPVDAAADQMGKGFLHDSLPPILTPLEKLYSGANVTDLDDSKKMKFLKERADLGVKLIRANIMRLVAEDDACRVYYSTDNTLEYHAHGEEPFCFEIPWTWTSVIEHLLENYPKFVKLTDLPPVLKDPEEPETEDNPLDVILVLWQRGLLLFDKRVKTLP